MAKVIDFFVPKRFRIVHTAQPRPGKLIEFGSRAKKSVPARPTGWALAWLLQATEPNPCPRH
jgi:hypothetical protein